MSFLRASIAKDVGRMVRDPAAVALSVGLPLLIGLLIRLTLGGGGSGVSPTAELLVADRDSTFVSRFLAGAFDQGPAADLVNAVPVTEEEGRKRLDEGKASGLLIIPEGFADAVFNREPTTLVLLTNPAQRILPGILEGMLGFLVDVGGIGQQILGGAGETLTMEPPPGRITLADSTVARFSTTVNRLVESAGPFLFPPAIKVETVTLAEAKEERGFTDLFFPSLFLMAIIFGAQSQSDDLWKERMLGTLRRTVTTPRRLAVFLLGKTAAISCLLALVAVAGIAAGKWIFGVNVHHPVAAMLWATASGAFLFLFFTLVQILAASRRGGNLLSNAVLFPMIMVGGSFFPFEAMPAWLARIGKLTPNGWALVQLKAILWGQVDPPVLAATVTGWAVFGGLLFGLCLLRLRRFARAS